MNPNRLRNVRLRPYRTGYGPRFSLTTYDTGRCDERGSANQRYRFVQIDGKRRTVLFEGEDYSVGAGQCSDSDDAVAGLLEFLTLKPGDTDDEYFARYTPAQRRFADQHAEMLSCEVKARFGDH